MLSRLGADQELCSGVATTHLVLQVLFLSSVGGTLVPVLCLEASARVYRVPLWWERSCLCFPFP